MAIDIGAGAIEGESSSGGQTDTWIDFTNPANGAGTITDIEIWLVSAADGLKVGIFYNTTGDNYKCRSATGDLGAISPGSKQTISGQSLAVEIGDVIGYTLDGGAIWLTATGGAGIGHTADATDHVIVNDEADYSTGAADYRISIFGSGAGESAGAPLSIGAQAIIAGLI